MINEKIAGEFVLKAFILGLLFGLVSGIIITILYSNIIDTTPRVDLPEEYELINPHEVLQGNYDKSNNTLHIWFNNKINNNE